MSEILKCDYSSESYWAVLSYAAVYYAVDGGSHFASVDGTSSATIQMKATEQYFPAVC